MNNNYISMPNTTFASHAAASSTQPPVELEFRSIDFRIGDDTFPIHVTHNNLRGLVQKMIDTVGEFDKLMLGYDTNTYEHCGSRLEPVLTELHVPFERYVIGVTEENKTFENLDNALGSFLRNGVSRKSIVVPVGGGIVSNLFGLAASLLFRGIRMIEMPTTFLNAHDAVTSQKTAVNHSGYKNIVGTFHMPTMVLCDTSFYLTLGESEIKSGLGELTKNAALFGGEHYDLIERTTLAHGPELSGEELADATFLGIKAKDALLCKDPREKHLALLFEYVRDPYLTAGRPPHACHPHPPLSADTMPPLLLRHRDTPSATRSNSPKAYTPHTARASRSACSAPHISLSGWV